MASPSRTFSFDHDNSRAPGHGSGPRDVSPISKPHSSAIEMTNPRSETAAATPGMDNLGPASVGGGIGGIAMGVANHNNTTRGGANDGYIGPPERAFNTAGADNPYIPSPPIGAGAGSFVSSDSLGPRESYGSNVPLGRAVGPAGQGTSGQSTGQFLEMQPRSYWSGRLNDGPYQRNSAYNGGDYPFFVNPDEIVDDGDDGILPPGRTKGVGGGAAAAAAGGASSGGLFGMFKKKGGGAYGAVPGGLDGAEKDHWLKPAAEAGSKKRGWLAGLVLGFIVVGAIVGGAVGGILGHRGNETREKGKIHAGKREVKSNGDLDKDSSEIISLMNNKDLHKVFPGIGYTPWGTQYPLCLEYPLSQDNVTRDMAVLSQLTSTVRLYGTDCNQTEMVLHAINQLELKDMRLWLGVRVDTNQTTTNRQLNQLYDIFDSTEDPSIFKGAIVGNEASFRVGSTKSEAQKNLLGYMNDVRDELKKRDLGMPVATSDLGDNGHKELANQADLVMSNVHPFFAGVGVGIDRSASWTYTFWSGQDASLTQDSGKKQVVSEVGWPSGGGNDCSSGNKCKSDSDGAVANVENMNKFMSEWVCQALYNGKEYFWYAFPSLSSQKVPANKTRFEAFDEPWKIEYNTKDEKWENKWGLMDSARKLKPGLKIPDCGGKTAS